MSDLDSYPSEWPAVSLQSKIDAGFRCVRCGHPNGMWLPEGNDLDLVGRALQMRLGLMGPMRLYHVEGGAWLRHHLMPCDGYCTHDPEISEHRILTVHHLDGVKENLAWWNLMPACQRCHLTIQGKVQMDQGYQLPHSEWFLSYVAGFYAQVLEEQPSREEVEADLVRYLILGQPHLEDHYREMVG